MPPLLSSGFLRPFLTHCERAIPLQPCFSTSTRAQADDLYKTLIDSINPAKTARPNQPSFSSRSSASPADSRNPTPYGIPPVQSGIRSRLSSRIPGSRYGQENGSEDSTGDLITTLERNLRPSRQTSMQEEAERKQYLQNVRQVEAQATRNWRDGDVYSPHDLSPVEMTKARQVRLPNRSNNLPFANTRKKGGRDVLDDLGVDPLKEYKNFAMMSEFVTEMGRIRHSRDTGLRAVNQRRMAKAVRRAIGIGIMPSVHKHPEMLDERVAARRTMQKPR